MKPRKKGNPKPKTEQIEPYQWPKGHSGNPNGRPRKLMSKLEGGYKNDEINTTVMNIAALDMEGLKKVFEDETATILERSVAHALYKGFTKASLYNLETVITRAHGKPKEQVEMKQEVNLAAMTVHVVKVDTPLASSESEVDTTRPDTNTKISL